MKPMQRTSGPIQLTDSGIDQYYSGFNHFIRLTIMDLSIYVFR